jgi:hypothetical protein
VPLPGVPAPGPAPLPPQLPARSGGGGGCARPVAAIVVLGVLLLIAGAVFAAHGGGSVGGPPTGWSAAVEQQFEADCQAAGGGSSFCHCARVEAEARMSEAEIRSVQAEAAVGQGPTDVEARDLRAAQDLCS